jgi:hypothetical protein
MSLRKFDGLSGSLAEVVEFGLSSFSASDGFYVDDVGRVEWEDSLDAFVIDDAADGEVFVYATAFAGDNGAGENLDAFLVAFFYTAANIDGVPDLEMREVCL